MKRKHKTLELSEECIKQLTIDAAIVGTVFKPYVESILEEIAQKRINDKNEKK